MVRNLNIFGLAALTVGYLLSIPDNCCSFNHPYIELTLKNN